MKIVNHKKFKREMENFQALKEASGCYNDDIILFCDYSKRDNKSLHIFVERLFSDCGIELNINDFYKLDEHFEKIGINYYSIKEYIIKNIDSLIIESVKNLSKLEKEDNGTH